MKFASKAKSFAGNVVKRQKKTTKNGQKWPKNGLKMAEKKAVKKSG